MSTQESKKPKSILKNSIPTTHASTLDSAASSSPNIATKGTQRTKTRSSAATDASKPPPDPRHLAVALHHANQIQAHKDAEALILNRILDLISLPSVAEADPASPSPSDAMHLKTSLIPFQPVDYDNLILERNLEGKCGYALCPREHRKEDPKVKFRILWGPKGSGANGRGREMKVVPREKLEMWCSDECAERAMYVRVQLMETPVWERRGDDTNMKAENILLLEESREQKEGSGQKEESPKALKGTLYDGNGNSMIPEGSHVDPNSTNLTERIDRLALTGQQYPLLPSVDKAKDLALERGDFIPAFCQQGRVDVQIMEKNTNASEASPPTLCIENQEGGSIEGYAPEPKSGESYGWTKHHIENHDADDVDDDDVLPTI